jgi:hypothetical protein
MTGALRIHALVIIARVLLRIGDAADDISAMCRGRAGRILDEAVAWCDVRDARRGGGRGRASNDQGLIPLRTTPICGARYRLRVFIVSAGRCMA